MSLYLGETPVAAPHQSLSNIVDAFYPVGSIFIGTTSTCPLAAIKGTWTLKSSGRVLQGADSSHSAGTTVEAGLPNITGTVGTMNDAGTGRDSGALSWVSNSSQGLGGNFYGISGTATFNASASNQIYGNSSTVQPPAYVVNIWERTA